MRLSVTVACALLLVAGGLVAQNHPSSYVLSGSSIQILTVSGSSATFTTVFNNPGSAHGVTMDTDNTNLVYGWPNLLRLDPSTGLNTTISTLPATEIVIDHKGDYIVGNYTTGVGYGLYRVNAAGITTIVTTLAIGTAPGSITGGLVRDVDTGNFVVQFYGGSSSLATHPMLSIAPDGTVTTVIATFSSVGAPRFDFTQDKRTGDFYVGSNDSVQGYLVQVAKNGTSTVVATSADRFAFNTMIADRGTAASPRLAHSYRANFYYTDLSGFTITSIAVTGTSVSPRGIDIYRSRNIQTVETSPRKFDLLFSLPAYPNKGYVAALSELGVRPGVPLGDGRTILLNPTALTAASVGNLLTPFFNAGPLVLDASGTAKGSMDLSLLPPLGITLHLVIAVLDTAAPGGLAVISDPYVMPI